MHGKTIRNSSLVIRNCFLRSEKYLGGYCGGVPPLPIPNREVKPACADGTAMQCGRVGGCLLYLRSSESNDSGDIFLYPGRYRQILEDATFIFQPLTVSTPTRYAENGRYGRYFAKNCRLQ